MAGWTNLTPSAGALAAGNAYLHEDAGALKYQGTSGSIATLVNADGTIPSSGGSGGGWEFIATVNPAGAATADFTNIPQTYKDLRLVATGLYPTAATIPQFQFGNTAIDSATSYAYSQIRSNATSVSSSSGTNAINTGTGHLVAYRITLEIPDYCDGLDIKSFTIATSNGSSNPHNFAAGTWYRTGSSYSQAVKMIRLLNNPSSVWLAGTMNLYGRL